MSLSLEEQEVAKSVGQRIRELRLERGLSQERLARAADLSYTTVNRLENGTRVSNIFVLSKIARALAVRPGELFTQPTSSPPATISTTSRGSQAGGLPEDPDTPFEGVARHRSLDEDADVPYPGKNSRAAA